MFSEYEINTEREKNLNLFIVGTQNPTSIRRSQIKAEAENYFSV